MHQQWVHHEHVINPKRYQKTGNPMGPLVVERNQSAAASQTVNLPLLMVVFSILILLATVPLLIVKMRTSDGPAVVSAAIPSLQGHKFETLTKKQFLARMSQKQRREFHAKVSYVANIIRSTKKPDAYELAYKIVSESQSQNYDPFFVSAVIMAESTFRKDARSNVGALGLMQLRPRTAAFTAELYGIDWMGVNQLRVPEYNIRLGIAYLKHLEEKYQYDTNKVLMAYNWGPGNLDKHLRNPRKRVPGVTHRYRNKITRLHHLWKRDFEIMQAETKYSGLLKVR